jgi:ribosome production factor 1
MVKKIKKRSQHDAGTRVEIDGVLVKKYRSAVQGDRKKALFAEIREQKKDAKRNRRKGRALVRKKLRDAAPPKAVPKTLERMRKPDDTFLDTSAPAPGSGTTAAVVEDQEIVGDEADDEFAPFFREKRNPRLLITTSPKPSHRTLMWIREAKWLFPNSIYRPRQDYTIEEILGYCTNRGFTDVMFVFERMKQPWGLVICHLPHGPTAAFRISNFLPASELEDVGERTKHYPELILKNFDTRLGRRVSRFFEALFPATRDYEGRAVTTFHNQRDFVFIRAHRYIFDDLNEVRIQELGPRFTLRLLFLQHGTFDTQFGEYEWFRKKEMETDKRRWFL